MAMALGWALAAGCAGPGSGAADGVDAAQSDAAQSVTAASDAAGWRAATTLDGATRVRWRGAAGAIPVNALFELELELAAGGAPLEGAEVGVSAFMPDHGHGLNYVPLTEELGGGRYRVDGLLFHMPGFWQLHVDVVRDGVASRASFDLEL